MNSFSCTCAFSPDWPTITVRPLDAQGQLDLRVMLFSHLVLLFACVSTVFCSNPVFVKPDDPRMPVIQRIGAILQSSRGLISPRCKEFQAIKDGLVEMGPPASSFDRYIFTDLLKLVVSSGSTDLLREMEAAGYMIPELNGLIIKDNIGEMLDFYRSKHITPEKYGDQEYILRTNRIDEDELLKLVTQHLSLPQFSVDDLELLFSRGMSNKSYDMMASAFKYERLDLALVAHSHGCKLSRHLLDTPHGQNFYNRYDCEAKIQKLAEMIYIKNSKDRTSSRQQPNMPVRRISKKELALMIAETVDSEMMLLSKIEADLFGPIDY